MGPLEVVILLLMVGLPVLAVVMVARALSARTCPRCGRRAARGQPECTQCGFDFRSIGG